MIQGKTDLVTIAPEIVKEWDFEKNGDLLPSNFTGGSHTSVWWKCLKYGHSWSATIASRVKGSGCPYCHSRTSLPEQAIYYYVLKEFPDAINTDKHLQIELDIYIPNIKTAIEYDGIYFHKKKKQKDIRKNLICNENGIRLIRIREIGLEDLSDCEIIWIKPNAKESEISEAISILMSKLNLDIAVDVFRDNIDILASYHQYVIRNTLLSKFPDIASEWDYDKNNGLTPEMFSYGSRQNVYWRCKNNHSWKMSINTRTNYKYPCPYCSGKRAIEGKTDFATNYPELMEEWDYKKNGDVNSYKILPKVAKRVWWKCDKGHEWDATINNRVRNKSGCPYCSGLRTIQGENDIVTTNPEILKEWDFDKNTKMTPQTIKAGSEVKVWWKCQKCGNSYKASPYARLKEGTACPYCANQVFEYTKAKREGEEIIAKNGQKMRVIKYRKAIDIDIQFEDGTIVEHRSYYSFLKGAIKNPNLP